MPTGPAPEYEDPPAPSWYEAGAPEATPAVTAEPAIAPAPEPEPDAAAPDLGDAGRD
jgi:hypothetical protein